MSSSDKKIAANRLNGQRSRGPTNTTSTRFNATKHGLLAVGITELDDADGYRTILSDLIPELNPVGVREMFLVESMALNMVKSKRARRLEAEYITSELNPPIHGPNVLGDDLELFKGALLDPGLPAALTFVSAQRLVSIYQRYETAIDLRLFRALHELERLQRMRKGERLAAPVAVDVIVHADPGIADAIPKAS